MPASGRAPSPGPHSPTVATAPAPGRRPVHDDLPTELARLRVIEFHLLQQLRRVREQIYEVETGDQPWASGPAPGWRLQRLPGAAGRPSRYVLHRKDCWIDDGQVLTDTEATAWAARWDVRACDLCKPNLQTHRPLPVSFPVFLAADQSRALLVTGVRRVAQRPKAPPARVEERKL
ncbi:DUF6233 domain-containing protein [Actinacidiphila glaucinigra]|uniref:DUF6233 domain-containing protein n=1 Tax=Actinacidiphila glaucinigra TaxID=235986 RepID=UPI003AF3B589